MGRAERTRSPRAYRGRGPALGTILQTIFKYLKEVSDYHREAYKLELRMRFWTQ
jgi:hypothetical protein